VKDENGELLADSPGPRHLEVEIASAKLKKYKSPSSDQVIQAGG
jgi:hypothetical protein